MDDLTAIGSNYLAALADDLRSLQAGIQRNAKQVASDAVEAGKKLIEAKTMLQHGQWETWLAANVTTISPRTARNYMRLARSGIEIGTIADLGINAALRQIAGPEDDMAQPVQAIVDLPPLPLPLIEPPGHGELLHITQERPRRLWAAMWQSITYPGFYFACVMGTGDDDGVIESMRKPVEWPAIPAYLQWLHVHVHDGTEVERGHGDPQSWEWLQQWVCRQTEPGWRKRQWENERALAKP
jgi:hypothetical protein